MDARPDILNENTVGDVLKARRKYGSIVGCRRASAGEIVVDISPLSTEVAPIQFQEPVL